MLDVETISVIVASVSIVLGIIYYAIEFRNQTKSRRAESFWNVFSTFNTKEFYEAFIEVHRLDFVDYEDFASKYGEYLSGKCTVNTSIDMVCDLFEGAAYLFERGLMAYESIAMLPVIPTWEKVKPIAEGVRRKPGFSEVWVKFEHAYNEIKKRKQQIQTKQ